VFGVKEPLIGDFVPALDSAQGEGPLWTLTWDFTLDRITSATARSAPP